MRPDLVHITPLFHVYAVFKLFVSIHRAYSHYITILYFHIAKYMGENHSSKLVQFLLLGLGGLYSLWWCDTKPNSWSEY